MGEGVGGGGYLARVLGHVVVQGGVTVSSNTDSRLIENNSETGLSSLLLGRKEVLDRWCFKGLDMGSTSANWVRKTCVPCLGTAGCKKRSAGLVWVGGAPSADSPFRHAGTESGVYTKGMDGSPIPWFSIAPTSRRVLPSW